MERVSSALAGGFFPTSATWGAGLLLFLLPRMEATGETAWELLLGAGVCSPCLHRVADHWRVPGDCAMPPVLTRCQDSPPVYTTTQPRWSPYLNDRHRTASQDGTCGASRALSACFPTPGYPGQGLPEPHPAPEGRRVPVPCLRGCPPASRCSLTPPPGWLDTPCPVPRGGSPGPGQSPGHKHDC